MTITKKGTDLPTRTVRWLEIALVLVGLAGPPVSFFMSTAIAKARQELVDARQDSDIASMDRHLDRIDARLITIEQMLNRVIGKLDKRFGTTTE